MPTYPKLVDVEVHYNLTKTGGSFMNWLLGRIMRQAFQMLVMKKRRNNRSLLLSMIGLGLSAVALRLMKGRNANPPMDPINQAVGEMGIRNPLG